MNFLRNDIQARIVCAISAMVVALTLAMTTTFWVQLRNRLIEREIAAAEQIVQPFLDSVAIELRQARSVTPGLLRIVAQSKGQTVLRGVAERRPDLSVAFFDMAGNALYQVGDPAALAKQRPAAGGVPASLYGIKDGDWVVSAIPFRLNAQPIGAMVVIAPAAPLGESERQLYIAAAALFFIFICIGLVGAVLIGRSITRPIIRLTRRIEKEDDAADADAWFATSANRDQIWRLAKKFGELQAAERAAMLSLEDQKQRAQRADDAKTAFVRTMSHDLRTPLNSIMGYSDAIRSAIFGEIQPTKYRDYVENIYRSGDHLLGLVNDILDVTHVESGEIRKTDRALDMPEIFADAVARCAPAAASGAAQRRIDAVVAPDAPVLVADRKLIAQMIDNLLINAIKYSPPDRVIRMGWTADGDGGALRVSDDGIGIPADQIDAVLQPFVQADNAAAYDGLTARAQEGKGLGLYIVSKLAAAYGAQIAIESAVGVGTTISVWFPRTVLASAAAPLAATAS